jgi:hypothetical protein
MYSPFSHGHSGRCIFTLPLPLTNIDAELASPMAPKSKPNKPVEGPTFLPPLIAPAPINAPWTSVIDSKGRPIPYLQQTTVPNLTVRKNAQSATATKTVRFLLLTHSDGGRVIEDNAGFTEPQYCLPNHPRYLGLMCQLGESLAANLNISSNGGGGGNKPGDKTWDVLVQLPLKYNAYYKSRKLGPTQHLDLYIAGHDFQKFDSVKQYALHLAWLAKEDDEGVHVKCECKVCVEERKKGVKAEKQVGRKSRWAEHCGPVMEGVPDWRA